MCKLGTETSASDKGWTRLYAHLITLQHLCLLQRLHRIYLSGIDLLDEANLHGWTTVSWDSLLKRWYTDFSESTLPDNLDSAEIFQAHLGSSETQILRLLLPKLLQLALLAVIGCQYIRGQFAFELNASTIESTGQIESRDDYKRRVPGVTLDGRLYGDLVKVLELHFGGGCSSGGILRQARGGALKVDVVCGFWGGSLGLGVGLHVGRGGRGEGS